MLQPRPQFQGIAGPNRKPSGGENDDFNPALGAAIGVAAVALGELTQRKEQFDTLAYDSANRDVEAKLTELHIQHTGKPEAFQKESTEFINARFGELDPDDVRTPLGITHHLGSVNRGVLRHTGIMNTRNDKATQESTIEEITSAGVYSSEAVADSDAYTNSETLAVSESTKTFNRTVHDAMTRSYSSNDTVISPEKAKEILLGYGKDIYVDVAKNRALSIGDSSQLRKDAIAIRKGTYTSSGASYDEGSLSLIQGDAISAKSVLDSADERASLAGFFERIANNIDRAEFADKQKRKQVSDAHQVEYLSSLKVNTVVEVPLGNIGVYDADTIRIYSGITSDSGDRLFTKFRLDSVDAIEIGQSFTTADGEVVTGEMARDYAVDWLNRPGITFRRTGVNASYGRALGVFSDSEGNTLGQALIERGFAFSSDVFGDNPKYSYIQSQVENGITEASIASQFRSFEEQEKQDYTPVDVQEWPVEEKPFVAMPTEDSMSPESWVLFKAKVDEIKLDNAIDEIIRRGTPRERAHNIGRLLSQFPSQHTKTLVKDKYNKNLSDFEKAMQEDTRNTIFDMYPVVKESSRIVDAMPPGLEKDMYSAEISNHINKLANLSMKSHVPMFSKSTSDGLEDVIKNDNKSQTHKNYGRDVATAFLISASDMGGNNRIADRALGDFGTSIGKPFISAISPVNAEGNLDGRGFEFLRPGNADNIANFSSASSKLEGMDKSVSASQVLREEVNDVAKNYRSAMPRGDSANDSEGLTWDAVHAIARWELAKDNKGFYLQAEIRDAVAKGVELTIEATHQRVGESLLIPQADWRKLTVDQQASISNNVEGLAKALVNHPLLKGHFSNIQGTTDEKLTHQALLTHASTKITINKATGEAMVVLTQNDTSDMPVYYSIEVDDKFNDLGVPIELTLSWVADNIFIPDTSAQYALQSSAALRSTRGGPLTPFNTRPTSARDREYDEIPFITGLVPKMRQMPATPSLVPTIDIGPGFDQRTGALESIQKESK